MIFTRHSQLPKSDSGEMVTIEFKPGGESIPHGIGGVSQRVKKQPDPLMEGLLELIPWQSTSLTSEN